MLRKNYTDLYAVSKLDDNTILEKLKSLYDTMQLLHIMHVAQNAILHYDNIVNYRLFSLPHKFKTMRLTTKFNRISARYARLHNIVFKVLIDKGYF